MFTLTDPDHLSFESLKYLSKGIDQSTLPESPSLWDILEDCRNGEGEIYTFYKGVCYLEFHPNLMNLAVLGGDDIKEWKQEFSDFIKRLMKERGIQYLSIIGRESWGRVFKELKPLATFYLYDGGELRSPK